MNKKAQGTTIGGILVAVFLFSVLVISGFTFYLGSLVDNDVALPAGINNTNIQKSFNSFESGLNETAEEIDSQKNQVPFIGGAIDFFATGVDSMKTAGASLGFMKEYVSFARTNTKLGEFLPKTFWDMLVAILTIILVFVGLGALWRYNLTR